MPVLLSFVTEDEVLERVNDRSANKFLAGHEKQFADPKAQKSFKVAERGSTLLRRIAEEKK